MPATPSPASTPVFATDLGYLYHGDCLPWLRSLDADSADLIFADPPFNLEKDYGKGINDKMTDSDYLAWCEEWLSESVRVLKPGGSLCVFNLPRWCIEHGAYLNKQGMLFKHWIACRMPKSWPIPGRMSPSHYGLLYYTKGKGKTFNIVRHPVQLCRHCDGEVKDYGGHRDKLNEAGLRLQDVFDAPEEVWENAPYVLPKGQGWSRLDEMWGDIPPVRHAKNKHRAANALAPLMMERIVAMTTDPGDLVIDPFAGSGTTLYAAEHLGRRWMGCELGDTAPAIERIEAHQAGHRANWEAGRGNVPAAAKQGRKRAARASEQPDLL